MNKQELFNTVWNGLKGQDFRRSQDEFGCLYRGPNGLKCSLGHLIPDSKYNLDLEGVSAYALIAKGILPDFMGEGIFIQELQTAHDHAESPDEMRFKLMNIANEYELEIPE